MKITVDTIVSAYVKSREDIRALKQQIEDIETTQRKREEWLLNQLQSQGAQNIKTPHGTVYVAVSESVTVGDWDAVLEWVKSNENWEYLNHAVNKTAVLELMGDKREHMPPPGVNYSAIRKAQIRKG